LLPRVLSLALGACCMHLCCVRLPTYPALQPLDLGAAWDFCGACLPSKALLKAPKLARLLLAEYGILSRCLASAFHMAGVCAAGVSFAWGAPQPCCDVVGIFRGGRRWRRGSAPRLERRLHSSLDISRLAAAHLTYIFRSALHRAVADAAAATRQICHKAAWRTAGAWAAFAEKAGKRWRFAENGTCWACGGAAAAGGEQGKSKGGDWAKAPAYRKRTLHICRRAAALL